MKVATQSPLTGGQAAVGLAVKRGAELALERHKGPIEAQGFTVELLPFDDRGRPEVAVANARLIVADLRVLLVVGHLDGVAVPASEVYDDARLALISPAAKPRLTDRNRPSVNRVGGRDDVQGVAAAEFAASLKIQTAAVIHNRTTYGLRVAGAFREHAGRRGVEVVHFEGTEETSRFDALLEALGRRGPELVYFAGFADQAAAFFREARAAGITAQFMGPDGLDSPDLVRIAGKAAVGAYYTRLAASPPALPGAGEFTRAFTTRFNQEPRPVAAQAFDATAAGLAAIASAIRLAGGALPSREAVAEAVRKVSHRGVTATIEFDGRGDLKKAPYFLLQVVSEDPARWPGNKEVRRLELAPER